MPDDNNNTSGTGGTPGNGGGAAGDGTGDGTPQTQGTQQQTQTFESWYGAADPSIKTLIDGHINGLKTALQTERQQRGTLASQINDLKPKAEKGSELERQLTALQATLAAAERRATFAEDALRPEVGCVNAKAAFALATAEELFDRQGRPDWNALRNMAPELFRKVGQTGSADGGAGNQQNARMGMNEIIRRAAGRG